MKSTKDKNKKESLRLAERRLPLDKEVEEARDRIFNLLEDKGYTVERKHPVWAIITNPAINDTEVQVEIEGANLDIVLLSDTTENLGGGFPLGGSWACKSTVSLLLANTVFAAERVESFFGVVLEGREHMASNWESVQDQLKFEESVRSQNENKATA